MNAVGHLGASKACVLLLAGALSAAGCWQAPAGSCRAAHDCPIGEGCEGGVCVPLPPLEPPGCRGRVLPFHYVGANVLLVVDQSGSMDGEISPGLTKWSVATGTLRQILTKYQKRVAFGLELFPSDDSCEANVVHVPIQPDAADVIGSYLGTNPGGGSTPLAASLATAGGVPELNDPSRQAYVLLLTDGGESCAGTPVNAVKALAAKSIETFVIGFGKGADAATLNAMAQEGGLARPTQPYYYQADDSATLFNAVDLLAQQSVTCDIRFDRSVDDPNLVFVFIGRQRVLRDRNHVNGWDYSGVNQITLYGPACEVIRGDLDPDVGLVDQCLDDSLL